MPEELSEQGGEIDEGVFGGEAVDDTFCGINAGAIDVVEENDAAGMGIINDVIADETDVFVLPVPGVDSPKNGLLSEGGDGIANVIIEGAVGWTEESDALAADWLDSVGGDGEVVEDLAIRKTGKIAMNPGMAAYVVAFAGDAGDLPSKSIDAVTKDKERSLGVSVV